MKNRRIFFNDLAKTWDKQTRTNRLLCFIEQLVPKFGLEPGQKVLDMGTGTGILIPFLLQSVGPTGEVVAVDFAEKMVEACRAKYAHVANVRFVIQSAEKLDFLNESFDAVTCFGLFPHLENKPRALYQFNRVLKLGGRLIIAHALSSEEIKAHHSNAHSVVAQDVLPEKAEMEGLLAQTGFTNISVVDNPGCYLCLSNKKKI